MQQSPPGNGAQGRSVGILCGKHVQDEPAQAGSPARVGSARPNTLDLLPTFSGTSRGFPSAASWVLSSDIRLQAGFASSRWLMLMGLYNMSLHKPRLA